MASVLKIIEPVVDNLTKDFEKCAPVIAIANKTGLKPGHIVGAGFIVGLLLILTGIASDFITAVMGFLYPAYMSFKALETPDPGDDVQWLTYWVVFILVSFLDALFGSILSFIPLYNVLKLVFYIYLFYPKSRGATVIYENFLKPLLRKYEGQIDTYIQKAGNVEKTITDKIHNE